jgi:hypothetical protein
MTGGQVESPSFVGRLLKLLLCKAMLDVIIVGGVVLHFYFGMFNPSLRGALDVADSIRVAGWVVDQSSPHSQIEIQLFIDGRFVANRVADQSRPDVVEAGFAKDNFHGFTLAVPRLPAGQHEARVYALPAKQGSARIALQQVGKSMIFTVDPDERSAPPGTTR